MTETMDRNDSFSHDDQAHDDQEIIELTDILDGVVEDDGNVKIDQSHSTAMSEKEMASVDGSLLSDDAIEAALLRIVEKKYAGQLDAIFVAAVERVVKREIEAIKQSILKDI